MTNVNIQISRENKRKLDEKKIIPRESYNDVVSRILKEDMDLNKKKDDLLFLYETYHECMDYNPNMNPKLIEQIQGIQYTYKELYDEDIDETQSTLRKSSWLSLYNIRCLYNNLSYYNADSYLLEELEDYYNNHDDGEYLMNIVSDMLPILTHDPPLNINFFPIEDYPRLEPKKGE